MKLSQAKSYPHLISMLFDRPHLITPQTHAAYCQWLEARLGGVELPQTPSHKYRVMEDDDDGDSNRGGPGNDAGLEWFSDDGVIIPVHGTLVMHPEDLAMSECGCPMESLNRLIDTAEGNSRVKTVIYDFRTPGGTVTGIPETGRKIAQSKKDTIAFTASQCCSGGIWLAEQCQQFLATPSSRVGSVGVYTLRMDLTGQMKEDGVKVNSIFAGKYKLLGAYWKPLTEDERDILQAGVDRIYEQFCHAMNTFRTPNDEKYGNGLVFDGEQAAEMGFTDGCVESLDELIAGLE